MTNQQTQKAELFTQLVLNIFQINGELLAAGDKLTESLGLSSALWQVMGALRDGPLHMAQIARNMGLSRQSVRRTVGILEQKKIVQLMDNPDHKRAMLVRLTAKGNTLLAQVSTVQVDWANDVASNLSSDDLRTGIRLLKQIDSGLHNRRRKAHEQTDNEEGT